MNAHGRRGFEMKDECDANEGGDDDDGRRRRLEAGITGSSTSTLRQAM